MTLWKSLRVGGALPERASVGFSIIPVARLFNGVIGFMASATLVVFSPPGGYFFVIIVAFWAWLLAGGTWMARFIGVVLVRRTRGRRASWAFAPVVVLVTALAIQLDGPLLLRFR